jgi:hypothetical protein
MARQLIKINTDKIPKLIKLSNIEVQLPTGLAPTSLIVNVNNSGVGGIDIGLVTISTFYYVYLVDGVSLVASLSETSPTGFSVYRKVGAFYTDTLGNIFKVYFYNEINLLTLAAKVSSTGLVSGESSDWLSGNLSNPTTGTYNGTVNSNIFSLLPNGVATPEGGVGSPNTAMLRINSTTSFNVFERNTSNGVQSGTFNLIFHKQGVDAVQPDWSL